MEPMPHAQQSNTEAQQDGGAARTRALLLHALPHPSAALCWRRLRYEITRKWTPAMFRGFRALHHQADAGGGVGMDFAISGRRLRVEFSIHYPFHALRLFVMSRRVPHGPLVARALHARLGPPELRARVARYLAEPRAVPVKEWLYRQHVRHVSHVSGEAALRRCMQALPPHHWSPAMDLAQLWDPVVRFMTECTERDPPEAFF